MRCIRFDVMYENWCRSLRVTLRLNVTKSFCRSLLCYALPSFQIHSFSPFRCRHCNWNSNSMSWSGLKWMWCVPMNLRVSLAISTECQCIKRSCCSNEKQRNVVELIDASHSRTLNSSVIRQNTMIFISDETVCASRCAKRKTVSTFVCHFIWRGTFAIILFYFVLASVSVFSRENWDFLFYEKLSVSVFFCSRERMLTARLWKWTVRLKHYWSYCHSNKAFSSFEISESNGANGFRLHKGYRSMHFRMLSRLFRSFSSVRRHLLEICSRWQGWRYFIWLLNLQYFWKPVLAPSSQPKIQKNGLLLFDSRHTAHIQFCTEGNACVMVKKIYCIALITLVYAQPIDKK